MIYGTDARPQLCTPMNLESIALTNTTSTTSKNFLEEPTVKPTNQFYGEGTKMEIYKLANKIVDDITEGPYYSEVGHERLKDVIFEYLNDEYNKMIDDLSVYFDIKRMTGDKITSNDYDAEFSKIKIKMLEKMEDIARTK